MPVIVLAELVLLDK